MIQQYRDIHIYRCLKRKSFGYTWNLNNTISTSVGANLVSIDRVIECINLLLFSGHDLYAKNDRGITAYELIYQIDHPRLVEFFGFYIKEPSE
jgi:hypothetical protein